jgi:serine/threonine protein kinase
LPLSLPRESEEEREYLPGYGGGTGGIGGPRGGGVWVGEGEEDAADQNEDESVPNALDTGDAADVSNPPAHAADSDGGEIGCSGRGGGEIGCSGRGGGRGSPVVLALLSENPRSRVFVARISHGGKTLAALRAVAISSADQTKAQQLRLRRSLARMRELRHENVVRVLGAIYSKGRGGGVSVWGAGDGVTEGTVWPRLCILYELCDAGSLSGLLADLKKGGGGGGEGGSTLGTPGSLRVLSGIANGLQYLHGHDIVHGDLRPSKVLFSSNGAVKITDFSAPWREVCRPGCQIQGLSPHRHLATGLLAGAWRVDARLEGGRGGLWVKGGKGVVEEDGVNERYCAPEVLRGDDATFASDVWSLGAIALHLFTGNVPYANMRGPEARDELARNGINLLMSEAARATGTRGVVVTEVCPSFPTRTTRLRAPPPV